MLRQDAVSDSFTPATGEVAELGRTAFLKQERSDSAGQNTPRGGVVNFSEGEKTQCREPAKDLARLGYAVVPRGSLGIHTLHWPALNAFLASVPSSLAYDPYDANQARARRYGAFLFDPSSGLLQPFGRRYDPTGAPLGEYYQDAIYNPDPTAAGVRRVFAGLRDDQINSRGLHELIRADFAIAEAAGVLPGSAAYLAGVHLIAVMPRPNHPAVSSPDELHCDGEPVTAVHLVERRNVTGGENTVSAVANTGKHPKSLPAGEIIEQFTLTTPLDGFIVDDRRVSHHVAEVQVMDPDFPAGRTVVLIDFRPMKPLSNDDLPKASAPTS